MDVRPRHDLLLLAVPPHERDRAAQLHRRAHAALVQRAAQPVGDDLLRLYLVGHVARAAQPALEQPRARKEARAARDHRERERAAEDREGLLAEEAVHDGRQPRAGEAALQQPAEEVLIPQELMPQLGRGAGPHVVLQRVGQVVRVRKVKVARELHRLEEAAVLVLRPAVAPRAAHQSRLAKGGARVGAGVEVGVRVR